MNEWDELDREGKLKALFVAVQADKLNLSEYYVRMDELLEAEYMRGMEQQEWLSNDYRLDD